VGTVRSARACLPLFVLALLASAGTGCGAEKPDFRLPVMPAADHFSTVIDHPFYPLPVGARWIYRGHGADGTEEVTVTVTPETRVVAGVTAVVVRDRSTVDGRLSEDTFDWFAQDDKGNVWYLGEDTTAYDPDGSTSTEGSWTAGVKEARGGIVMPAHPTVGDRYEQEHLAGVAEDRGEILTLSATGKVPWGPFTKAIRTRDTTPLEPKNTEYKYYARGVGDVLEQEGDERLELVSFTPPAG
jgi:hypothetical protein